jgi:hypothetical protein
MGHTSIVLALLLAALAGFALVLAWGDRWNPSTRRGILVALIAATAIGHTHSLTRGSVDSELTIVEPTIHLHEFLHYYLGSKYYRELGHDPLYEAIVIADHEDDRANFRPRNRFRDLRSNRVDRIRGDVIHEGSLAKQRFEPERWQSFKTDVALLRSNFISRPAWHRSVILRDHGYNGSPLTTLSLGTLANQTLVSTLAFFQTMRWMDLTLVAVLGVVLGVRLGVDPVLGFGLLWLANPLNDFGFVGGSFLRYNFALALILAWLALDAGQLKRAGAWLAIAAHLRVFPALFAAGLLLHDLARPNADARRRALRRNAPLYGSFAATGLVLVAVTALTPAPEGENVWQDFRGRITVHAQSLAFNAIGIAAPFGYSEEQSVAARRAAFAEGEAVPWEDIVESSLAARRPARLAASAVLFALTFLCARRLPPRYALFLGFPLLFALIYASHYYYLSLGLLALVFHDHKPALLALATGFGAIALAGVPTFFADDVLRFAVASALVIVMLGAIGVLALRAPQARGASEPVEPA